jgi:hypothetical protein
LRLTSVCEDVKAKRVEKSLPESVVVAQSVEVLHYKQEGHAFDSRWGRWDFSLN